MVTAQPVSTADSEVVVTSVPFDASIRAGLSGLSALYVGVVGELVRLWKGNTEACREAIAQIFVVSFGNLIGRSVYIRIDKASVVYTNLYLLTVGQSGERKGTAWRVVKDMLRRICESDEDFAWFDRLTAGLSSGEGLIHSVRDPITKWNAKEQTEVVVDPGIKDKRQLCIEEEFDTILSKMPLQGNTLGAQLRMAYDSPSELSNTKVKGFPIKATRPHISLIAQSTPEDLMGDLSIQDIKNGFGNRFIFGPAYKAATLPEPPDPDEAGLAALAKEIRAAKRYAQVGTQDGELKRSAAARDLWKQLYVDKYSVAKPALVGHLTARAAVHCLKTAAVYAVLEQAEFIEPHHLEAGDAMVELSAAQVHHLWGGQLGNRLADQFAEQLPNLGDTGSRMSLKIACNKGATKPEIDTAFFVLVASGKFEHVELSTPGRLAKGIRRIEL